MNDSVSLGLDFSQDDTQTGFRLQSLQVLNWGTFDRQVWNLNLGGRNALLTGDIGSGKSTLVDAVTTLLVPAHRVAYNKAAGAEQKERSLRSYVLGYYKAERSETTGKSKPVALRDPGHYSVILGVFYNQGYDQSISLAQVFWVKDPQAQPERFFVGSERVLDIAADFSGFGSDMKNLRKRLRDAGDEIWDSFPPYSAWFRRRFGIDNEQALDLFHQTVSMKSVGNLTDFVRQHMLEAFDVEQRIESLIAHFDDLNRAHAAVLTARRQIDLLTPLVKDCALHAQVVLAADNLRACREALSSYFDTEKLQLVQLRSQRLQEDVDKRQKKLTDLQLQAERLVDSEQQLKQQIAENGGDRIQSLQHEINLLSRQRQQRQEKAGRYASLLAHLQLDAVDNETAFMQQQEDLQKRSTDCSEQQTALQNSLQDDEFEFRQHKQQHDQLQSEINSLQARKSNIDQQQILIRQTLCEALALEEDSLPFAGELLQVREDDKHWQGAVERLLRNFGLSLLVPEQHYEQVAAWVDQTHLRGRLVYYRIPGHVRVSDYQLHAESLVHKLAIKPDTPFYLWLEQEIARRFDYACCDNQQQFKRERRAITLNGQLKTAGERHEKDDRFSLNDRSRYVLGWNNVEKILALQNTAQNLQNQMADTGLKIANGRQKLQQLAEQLGALGRLEEYRDFTELNWQALVSEIEMLEQERLALESASDLLKTLSGRLTQLQQDNRQLDERVNASRDKLATLKERLRVAAELEAALQDSLDSEQALASRVYFESIRTLRSEAKLDGALTVESCDNRQQELRGWLQARIDSEDKRQKNLQQRIVQAMSDYRHEYPLQTRDVDVAVESADEFSKMLDELQADDLPRFEERFKELLNENTIREVANFQSQLNRERESIRERIERINESLTQIDYSQGRYILLEARPTQDAEIRDFQHDLKTCTEGSLTGSNNEQYSEAKFIQVKQLIERFRGREGSTELDKRWTRKVTDVRNWFGFSASERWREDDAEYEHYTDSGGKSGGQKEKLAYTILAASLAYQFGLEWGEVRSRSFRFVVIDEAFGRGSDESAEYGLKLFKQLNLQLLIVTPLQKIHIIEPFVAHVGFVHNEAGKYSRVRNLSIEAYRLEKQSAG